MTEKIIGFIHTAFMGTGEAILRQQLRRISKSGLLAASSIIYLSTVGPNAYEALRRCFVGVDNKKFFIRTSPHLQDYEAFTLKYLYKFALENTAKVWYIHSKGATRENICTTVKDWRELMEYFVIDRYRDCVEALDTYAICGCNWHYGGQHFSGNFWWANSAYIKTLPPMSCPPPNRMICETWIGMGERRSIKILHDSGVNHCIKAYPKHLYVKEAQDAITTNTP